MINTNKMQETVSAITKSVDNIVESMKPGTRYVTKEIVEQVVNETQVPIGIATGIVALAINNCSRVKQRAGRNGGVYKLEDDAPSNRDMIAKIASNVVQNMDDAGDEDDYGND